MGGKGGFDPKVIGYCCTFMAGGAKGKFGGAMPPFAPPKSAYGACTYNYKVAVLLF